MGRRIRAPDSNGLTPRSSEYGTLETGKAQKGVRFKNSGIDLYYTSYSSLVTLMNVRSRLHCPKGFNPISFPYKILVFAFRYKSVQSFKLFPLGSEVEERGPVQGNLTYTKTHLPRTLP